MKRNPQIEELNRVLVDFLRTDLLAGLTFSTLALQTSDLAKRDRNRQNARKAYNTVTDKLSKVSLTLEEVEGMTPLMQRLRSELETMGELF